MIMFIEKIKPILKGYIKAFISKSTHPTQTGGTNEAAYCYSTWLRHLIKMNMHVRCIPEHVLELGPGDSLGVGICALLSGAKSYTGVDIYKYWQPQTNVQMFEQLVKLFTARADMANEKEYPRLTPYLNNYNFPYDILSEEILRDALAPARLDAIRNELASPQQQNKYVKFYSPWRKEDVPNESIDFIFSQSVLQYTDLNLVYSSMQAWMKVGGLSAHVIDFSSLGITKTWNGHWSFSDREWKHYSYKKNMLLNRAPYTSHKELLESINFEIIHADKYFKANNLKRDQLGESFKGMSDEDLSTHAAYVLSKKKQII